MKCWKDHFENLSTSQSQSSESIPSLHAHSYSYNDEVLDTPFSVEEIECAVRKLKCGKGSGADELKSEHLNYGGRPILLWPQRIFNAVIQLDNIPPCLKLGVIITPSFQCSRARVNPNNYRGITLTSVISEIAFVRGLYSPVLLEKGFPHQAYQRGISCADAIFSTQETLLKHIVIIPFCAASIWKNPSIQLNTVCF